MNWRDEAWQVRDLPYVEPLVGPRFFVCLVYFVVTRSEGPGYAEFMKLRVER